MTNANLVDFETRARRIARQHRKMARGYVTTITRDGLIIHRPRRSFGPSPRGIVITLAVLLSFKVMLFSYLGPITYAGRIAKLEAGTMVEQAGAWVMQAGPATEWVAETFKWAVSLLS